MTIDEIEALISKHGSITAQPLMDLVVTVVLEAVEAEREACAQICDTESANESSFLGRRTRTLAITIARSREKGGWVHACGNCAALIRARGEK